MTSNFKLGLGGVEAYFLLPTMRNLLTKFEFRIKKFLHDLHPSFLSFLNYFLRKIHHKLVKLNQNSLQRQLRSIEIRPDQTNKTKKFHQFQIKVNICLNFKAKQKFHNKNLFSRWISYRKKCVYLQILNVNRHKIESSKRFIWFRKFLALWDKEVWEKNGGSFVFVLD